MNVRYITSYFQFKLSSLVAGTKYGKWKDQTFSLQYALIKNPLLAKELETACEKDGFLTYAEFLQIEQFGNYGYHRTHSLFGEQMLYENWPKAIAALCLKNNIHNLVEFGPGNGTLSIEAIKEGIKTKQTLTWSGIEINEKLQKEIQKKFQRNRLPDNLTQMVSDMSDLNIREKSLGLFSYSLDSVPPEIFLNTSPKKGYPNTMIGVTIHNGELQEIVLTETQLKRKGITLKNGIYEDATNMKFDLKAWHLFSMQRAYIPIQAYTLFLKLINLLPKGSCVLVIDEFLAPPKQHVTTHLGVPKDLLTFKRAEDNIKKAYEQAGDHLLYYPFYFHTFSKLLKDQGVSVTFDIEQRMAKTLSGKDEQIKSGYYLTYAFLTAPKTHDMRSKITLSYPTYDILSSEQPKNGGVA